MTEAEYEKLQDLLWDIVYATQDHESTLLIRRAVEVFVEGVVERVKRGDQ